VRLEGLGKKKSITSLGLKPMTFQLEASSQQIHLNTLLTAIVSAIATIYSKAAWQSTFN
jgi:hypothetical protein